MQGLSWSKVVKIVNMIREMFFFLKAKEYLVYLNVWIIKILKHDTDMHGLSRSKAILKL
jgi:hypothetical protein